MSWTYSGDPSNSDLDETRFTIGDTDTDSQILTDEEVLYLFNKYEGTALLYQLFTSAASHVAKNYKRALGTQSEEPLSRLEYYSSQAIKYENILKSSGLSIPQYAHEKVFKVGMNDNPPVGHSNV